MHQENGQNFFSPSDLADFAACNHATTMELLSLVKTIEKRAASDELRILRDHGELHELAFLQKLETEGRQVVRVKAKGDFLSRVDQTLSAMQSGAEVIFQAALQLDQFRGFADFLIRVDTPSNLGNFSYQVADTKLAIHGKARHLIQVIQYSEMIGAIQGSLPISTSLELGSGESATYIVRDYLYYVRQLRGRFVSFINSRTQTQPEHCNHCKVCPWADHCESEWLAVDHLNQIAGITKSQIKKLRSMGISTLSELANLEDRTRDLRINQRLLTQARLQYIKKQTGVDQVKPREIDNALPRGFLRLPEPNEGDLYFDMEGYPYEKDGLEYLFGVTFIEGGSIKFKTFWAHTRFEEKKAFEEFIDFVSDRRTRYPGLHIYHYADYERRALRVLMQRHATREKEVDSLLREQKLVDLYVVVREAIQTSEAGYSIKNLESFYMKGRRSSEVKTAGASIVYYERFRKDSNPAWLDSIESYNKDDCDSTYELHKWLIGLRSQDLPWYTLSRPLVADEVPIRSTPKSTELDEEKRVVREGLERYLSTHQNQGDREEVCANLLLLLLDFFWRELKPKFWRMFDRQKLSVEDLLDDLDVLASLQLDPTEPPRQIMQSKIFRYRFPPQEHKLQTGASLRAVWELKPFGRIEKISDAEGFVDIRLGTRMLAKSWEEGIPTLLSVSEDVNIRTTPLEAAIVRLARSFLADSDVGQMRRYQATYQLLSRSTPSIEGVDPGESILTGSVGPDSLTNVALRMQSTYLVVQGPPGTGKTWTGARVILRLLASGKRVGICALSHHAIINLLNAVVEAASEVGQTVSISRKGDESEAAQKNSMVSTEVKNEKALARRFQLVCGTAWLFADKLADQAFDYLFLDEAGQSSLANLVAMSTAAKNIVLLGDQRQLGQPLQGSHPQDTGLSALEYILKDHATVPANLGILLNVTYRMHPSICQFISEAIYESRLNNHPKTAIGRIVDVDPSKHINASGIHVVFVDHAGCSQQSEEEAVVIHNLVENLMGRRFIDHEGQTQYVGKEDILVVAPYNAQVKILRERLGEVFKVGTVDKFQGQEAPIVIISMTTSSQEDMPRNLDFLLGHQRINVAVSRAKITAVVVLSQKLQTISATTIEQIKTANLLCRLKI